MADRGLENFCNLMETREYTELAAKISVVVPCRSSEGMSPDLTECFQLWTQAGIHCVQQKDPFGGFIEVTRAHIGARFIAGDRKFLLMIDSDMVPDFDLPFLLARHDKPVVGAVCCSAAIDGRIMAVFAVRASDGTLRFPRRHTNALPERGLIPVEFCGSGAMMIQRNVLTKFSFQTGDLPFFIPEPLKARGVPSGYMGIGEDFAFCYQLQRKGIPLAVDLEARVGHRKMMVLGWEHWDPELKAEDLVLEPEGPQVGLDAGFFELPGEGANVV